MHSCRPHSNLWGKDVLWGDDALATDHIGFYSGTVKAFGEPSGENFHEQYPHMVSAWVYDHQYLDAEFNYEDLEKKYLAQEASNSSETANDTKAKLDQARNMQWKECSLPTLPYAYWLYYLNNPVKAIYGVCLLYTSPSPRD